MTHSLAETAAQLRRSPLVDRGLLKAGGRHEVEAAIARWQARGLFAHVLVLDRGEELAPWHELAAALALDSRRDLLLLFNGEHWQARGWGLSAAEIERRLQAARPGLSKYYGRGLVEALDGLGAAASGQAQSGAAHPPGAPRASVWPLGLGVMGAGAALTALLLIIRRRNRRAQKQMGGLSAARAEAEQAYAELVLAAEELGREPARTLQLRATELKRRLDAVSDADPLAEGRIRQLRNELAALHSEVLQRRSNA
jgi:hypothetical protein